jgi:hypothetical protein
LPGAWFLLAVAPQSLAVLCFELARAGHSRALFAVGLGTGVFSLVLYLAVLSRFAFAELRTGRGDHWVAGGALAISALAAAQGVRAARAVLPAWHGAMTGVAIGTWAAAVLWLPVLVAAEALWPRPGYSLARWSTVYPVGMYAAASLACPLSAAHPFGRVWVWVALGVWMVTAALAAGRWRRCPAPGRRAGR